MLKEQSLDSNFHLLSRKRLNFVWGNNSYAIDVFENIKGEENVHLLRFNTKIDEIDAK